MESTYSCFQVKAVVQKFKLEMEIKGGKALFKLIIDLLLQM